MKPEFPYTGGIILVTFFQEAKIQEFAIKNLSKRTDKQSNSKKVQNYEEDNQHLGL